MDFAVGYYKKILSTKNLANNGEKRYVNNLGRSGGIGRRARFRV